MADGVYSGCLAIVFGRSLDKADIEYLSESAQKHFHAVELVEAQVVSSNDELWAAKTYYSFWGWIKRAAEALNLMR